MANLVGGISSGARALPDLDGEAFRVARAAGPYVWSMSGERYVDTALGYGATVLGHAPPSVVEAVCEAAKEGPMPAYQHDREERAAATLAAQTGALSRIVFLNSGSEAVHLACKAARAATGRGTIAKLAAGYDGWFEGVALGNALSPEAEMTANSRPSRHGTVLLRYHNKADVDALFAENDDIAAILFEPMMANSGCLIPDPGYLRHLTKTAHAHGALVIADEVLMGFRLHAGLASDLSGLKVDFATLGKAIGSGFAVAALAGTPEAMAVLEDGRLARQGTYNGNPVACAAVLSTMAELAAADYHALARRGDALRADIVSAFAEAGMPVCTTGYGPVFTIWLGSQIPTDYHQALALESADFTSAIHEALRREGVLSMPCRFGRHYLSHAHDQDVCQLMADIFVKAARRVETNGCNTTAGRR